MRYSSVMSNLLEQAKAVEARGISRVFELTATLITPQYQIPLIIPTGLAKDANFVNAVSDQAKIKGQLQPGVYFEKVLAAKDNLYIELTERQGTQQKTSLWRAIPLDDNNPAMGGQSSQLTSMKSLDANNLLSLEFQLLDVGYDKLRNLMISNIFLMGTLDNVLHHQLTESCAKLGLTGPDTFKGVNIDYPIDNTRTFKQIIVPNGVKLTQLANFLQNDDHYGFYSKGLGCFYRKGMWYIYPLYKMGRYATARKVADIFRMPQDVSPTLPITYFLEDRNLTIMSTGNGNYTNGTDIIKQNEGTGKRVINPESLMGEQGYYYGAGRAASTRQDSLTEYKTSERSSGEEIVPFHGTPTANICKVMTQNAFNDGELLEVEWHNADYTLIDPGMPCKYHYTGEDDVMYVREGVILAIRSEYQNDAKSIKPTFREHAKLQLFLTKDIVVDTTSTGTSSTTTS